MNGKFCTFLSSLDLRAKMVEGRGEKAAEQEGEQYSLQFPRAEGTRNVVGESEQRASHKIWQPERDEYKAGHG